MLAGAVLDHEGPLEMAAEQAATLLWSTPTASAVTVRLDYTTRPASRGIIVRGSGGTLEWTVATGTVRHTDRSGQVAERTFAHDLDRDAVMTTQVQTLLADGAPSGRHGAGPATLREGLAAVALCDAARALAARPRSEETP